MDFSIVTKKLKLALIASLTVTLLASCGSDESNSKPAPDYPVLAKDTDGVINMSRGNFLCFDMDTSFGLIKLALDEYYAPATTDNFRKYVAVGFYDSTIFHRVIEGFMVQGGGYDTQFSRKATMAPIAIESRNGLSNFRGRIAMARTQDPNSATSQFFINTVDNSSGLDQRNAADGYGYTVFGGVIEGMDVVDQIEAVSTGSVGGMRDVPVENVVINTVREVDCPAG